MGEYEKVLEVAKRSQHVWFTDHAGKIDTWAWEPVDEEGYGIHSGPECRECGYHFCVWCVVGDPGEVRQSCDYFGWDDDED